MTDSENTLLTVEHFEDYFLAVHGSKPFPWQKRLLDSIAMSEDGRWPDLLDLPTGSGKTASIDVAIFHLAMEAAKPASTIRAPRRIVLVVDRRTVVDQAYRRAEKIAKKLDGAADGVLRVVRERLERLCGDEASNAKPHALAFAQLRGGMPRDDGWARLPDQPLVAVSTVDQVGSRILFRGYGVSDTMKPIHAGLLANDTLFLLDEVHLAEPFKETLEAIAQYRSWHRHDARPILPDRWQIVPMSATAKARESTRRFTLDDGDREDPILQRRLRASKPAICPTAVKVSGPETVRRRQFAEALTKQAIEHATGNHAVAVVVNRVATALEIFTLVSEQLEKKNLDVRVELVTGRMRPLDRDALDARLSDRIASGNRDKNKHEKPIIVVATQCIEAGADFDFDALVTECASLDALRQRFGRLNRLGEIDGPVPAVILTREDALSEKEIDPVYGLALKKTWSWLTETQRDFGIEIMDGALASLESGQRDEMLPSRSRAPVMLPAHLDAWAQTGPIPAIDPEISFWLHGKDRRVDADVQIVWRADLEDVFALRSDDAMRDRIEACFPTGLEALAVPIAAARVWLAGMRAPSMRVAAADFADVEGAQQPNDDQRSEDSLPAYLWQGDQSRFVSATDLRPGMTLVVPSSYGGLAFGTWDPSSPAPVSDLGDHARWRQTGRAVLRLHPAVMASWEIPLPSPPPQPPRDESLLEDELSPISEWLEGVVRSATPTLQAIIKVLLERRPAIVRLRSHGVASELPGYYAVSAKRTRFSGDASTEGESSSVTGVPIRLDAHMKGVGAFAEGFAKRCGLPPSIVRDLQLAGRWHDAGKVDPRFQRWLRGGSPLADVAERPLAKSGIALSDRAKRRRARERSGYPAGARHELASLALLEQPNSLLDAATDRELVLHLVASHHGWCRPFAPVVDDREPVDLILSADSEELRVRSDHPYARLGSGVAERYWRLVDRYGWFGLAWLEAILRLADHRRSELEQRGECQPDEEDA